MFSLSSYVVNHIETSCFIDIYNLDSIEKIEHKKQAKLVSKKMLNEDDYFEFLDFGHELQKNGISLLLGFTNLTNNLISFYYQDGELSKVTGKMRMGKGKVLEVSRKKNFLLCRASDGTLGILGVKGEEVEIGEVEIS